MNKTFKKLALFSFIGALMLSLFTSCEGNLNKSPITEFTSEAAFKNPASYEQFLAKIYAGLAISGQQGPAGNPDIAGIDEGFSNYLRQYWMHEELTTDEAVLAWNDGTVHDLHNQVWNSSNEFIRAMYDRIYFQIGLTNEFLRQTTPKKLDARGVSGTLRSKIITYRAEARFMRALSYWHAIDMYGNIPFVTENDPVGNFFPPQKSRSEVFDYIISELKAIEPDLKAPRQNELGRADQAADWMLQAKLYLNASVYKNQDMNTEALTELNKILNAGYSLAPKYSYLFLADNDTNGAQNETIFSVRFDGLNTQGYGGTTFLIHAEVGGNMDPSNFGINGGWWGLRTTSTFVSKFADITGATDQRAMFFTSGQSLAINDEFNFNDGYAIGKYKNVTSAGVAGSDPSGNFPDTDFIMFRLGDAYLMYAEAVLRGGSGGDMGTALSLVNQLRERAYGNTSGNITSGDLTLNFILNERARELYWEGTRRTDLIRFGEFSDNGVWPWKGGSQAGRTTEKFRDLYPIPSTDMIANPNLVQNPGY